LLGILTHFTVSSFESRLPGAIGMYGLSLGIANIGDELPAAVYALLSGLNAATVGIVVLAAVQLSQKVITDRFTRCILFLGASAGMLYNALWYFPLLMVLAGASSIVWDSGILARTTKGVTAYLRRHPSDSVPDQELETADVCLDPVETRGGDSVANESNDRARVVPSERRVPVTLKQGCFVIAAFLVSFIIIIALRGALPDRPFLFSLFSNFYLAGTIIFGGGPVVIPLLRE
jgi:chromate transport protein ChrA